MKKRESLKITECILIDCVSYTVVSVILALLSMPGKVMALEYRTMLELFFCTTLICAIMYGIGKLPLQSTLLEAFLQLLDVAVVILGVGGGLFHWFPWKGEAIWIVVCVFVATYFVTYGVMLLQNKVASDKINLILKEKRK